jgi:branched-chain amino acid transport system substrate-binding protein
MTHKLTRRSAAKGLTLSAAALAFPAIGRAQAQSVKIAMIAPMSGPWARQGQLLRMGADLAVDDINARGGIKSLGGAKLKIIYADPATAPKRPRTRRSAWWPTTPIWSAEPARG